MEQNTQPKIQSTEISDWENKFKQNVSPLVKFNTDGDNGTSFKLYNGTSGIEVEWSGDIVLGGEDFIKWKFSILNDIFIQASFKMTEENKDLIRKIYDLYTVWVQKWAQSISGTTPDQAQDNSGQNPLNENRTVGNIIKSNKNRMTILAGLK